MKFKVEDNWNWNWNWNVVEDTFVCWKVNMMMKFEQVEIWSQRNLKQKKFNKVEENVVKEIWS